MTDERLEKQLEEQQQPAERRQAEFADIERRLVDELFRDDDENACRRSERIKKKNMKDLEERKVEENIQYRRHLAGLRANVTMYENQINEILKDQSVPAEKICEMIGSIERAWNKYKDSYRTYIFKAIPDQELSIVEERFTHAHKQYTTVVQLANERLIHLQSQRGNRKTSVCMEENEEILSLSAGTRSPKGSRKSRQSSKSKTSSKRSSKNAEIARLEQETIEIEAELEKQKLDIEIKKQRELNQLKMKTLIKEKELESIYESSDSDEKSENERKANLEKNYEISSVTSDQLVDEWLQSATMLPDDMDHEDIMNRYSNVDEKQSKYSTPIEEHVQPDNPWKSPNLSNRRVTTSPNVNEQSDHWSAKLLKVNMLQAMRPIAFQGNCADFPIFRNRIRDNLEDGLLTDAQKVEFLPKFVSGEAYEVVERASGCSYDDIVKLLEDRFGQPAAVATSCFEKLVNGPKLSYGDNKGLLNFAEQIEAASKKLKGEYEREASTTSNLKLIIARLPGPLIGKWGETLYNIRQSGTLPTLRDVAKFVKKQAAIKNDPTFVPTTQNTDFKVSNRKNFTVRPTAQSSSSRQTVTFATATSTPSEGHKFGLTTGTNICPCCYGLHDLHRCDEFSKKDIAERWKIVKEKRLCHKCLKAGHHRDQCKFNGYCKCNTQRQHNKLLHNTARPSQSAEQRSEQPHEKKNENEPAFTPFQQRSTAHYMTSAKPEVPAQRILLHVVPVMIKTPQGNSLTTYALLDNGSRATVIEAKVAKQLQLNGIRETVSVSTLLDRKDESMEVVKFVLQPVIGPGKTIPVENGLVSTKFNVNETMPEYIDKSEHPHLAEIVIPKVDIPRVTIIIGKDVAEAHEILDVRKPVNHSSQLQGLLGPLGWVITGTLNCREQQNKELAVNFTDVENEHLRKQIEKFWKLDSYGNTQENLKSESLSRDDLRALEILDTTTKLTDDGHYETGLLWKRSDIELPNNRESAEKRLMSLKRKFMRDKDYTETYQRTMNDYIDKGHARKLSPNEVKKTGPRTWYLPHFGVTNINKPGKVRIVFDAAAESKGTSLNKNLLQGPDQTNSLVGVLLRFRQQPVAFVADIEGMFHQIKVVPEDQDSLRFLWWTDSLDGPPDEYVMAVHVFGASDSPCAASATLRRTADDNSEHYDRETINTVKNNFYVDDVLKSLPDTETAVHVAKELVDLCSQGGFKLTKFSSNDRQVLAHIPEHRRATPFLDLNFEEFPTERALGLQWNMNTDTFGFKVIESEKPNTMRGVLSTISAVFDPLNFVCPVILMGKQIMQELWRRKYSWDEPLRGEVLQRWLKWKNNLPLLSQVAVPRCYFSSMCNVLSTELHHFCDASEVGYGTVSYLRTVYESGEIETAFVMGKARNAPLKSVSIPRLELQSAVLATRMDRAIRCELEVQVSRIVFWTDSMITLNYIKNETKRFQTYVANRVTEIRENSEPEQWRHCPGKLNPADDASRGLDIQEFLQEKRWFAGPEFLLTSEENWPKSNLEEIPIEQLEIKKETFLTSAEHKPNPIEKLLARYSDWMMLLRAVAILIKFSEWMKNKQVKSKGITHDDIEMSKLKVASFVQKQEFPDEIKVLDAKPRVSGQSRVASLKPILRDNVLRVGGRISRAPISADAMNPIILPRNHHVTILLIRYIHGTNGHCGHEQTLALVREQFWILQARTVIRQVLRKCITCRKQMAPRMTQEMGDLPSVRLTPYEPPFTFTGVDYFGPFYVKRGRGRVAEKRWGAIFVCLTSRAVHLEVAKSLETDDFIMVLIRFLNRRGHVKEIRSDNGTNFVGAEREIREAVDKMKTDQVEKELIQRGCKWVFHPPTASHMSGVWERLVKVVKRSLKAIIGQDLINDEILHTVFTEAERIANSRPLTRNPLSPNDEDALTPNHFLNVRPSVNIPTDGYEESDKWSKKRWRQAQLLSAHYWKRWLKEYVPSLQERSKWRKPHRNLQVGDLVLVADDNIPRYKWPLARVIEVYSGSDGLVRSVKLRCKGSSLKRPVTKIALLEAADATDL